MAKKKTSAEMAREQSEIAKVEGMLGDAFGSLDGLEQSTEDKTSTEETQNSVPEQAVEQPVSVEQSNAEKTDEDNDLVEVDGFLMPKRLLSSESNRTCPTCSTYSFDKADDFYMYKFECCEACYIKWVEGREERWQSGWRPPKEK